MSDNFKTFWNHIGRKAIILADQGDDGIGDEASDGAGSTDTLADLCA